MKSEDWREEAYEGAVAALCEALRQALLYEKEPERIAILEKAAVSGIKALAMSDEAREWGLGAVRGVFAATREEIEKSAGGGHGAAS